ncbi:unnamed protein product [Diplocarpon coronariae]|uniref:Myb-like domain-containing protein n=1 Tax=Diplocarpon coronariae TaxID=2795749 RepID=A0A218Z9N3_9HELO|nr:hypothetical protein JHW43_000434 [Diplocarpon mali]OWP04777.1 hypothetical protein B2J93_4059 [Marssonina coronariae]
MTRASQASGVEENFYLINLGQKEAPEFTPYIPEPLFNLPIHYDSSLLTPVSMDGFSSLAAKPVVSMNQEPDVSPTYSMYYSDVDFGLNSNTPMKYKHHSRPLPISTADNFFPPGSPLVCSSPYYGHDRASGTSQSTTNSLLSPSFTTSSSMQSFGGFSNSSYDSGDHTPALSQHTSSNRGSQGHITITPSPSSPLPLLAPSPENSRSATELEGAQQLQCSFQVNRSPHQSYETPQETFSREETSNCSSKGKRKAAPVDYEKLMACPGLSEQDRYLLQLSMRDRIPWKEIAIKYNKAFPLKAVQVPALQMRKKRIVERFREWSELKVQKVATTTLSTVARGEC